MRPLIFPQDELPHKDAIEWWYFNGHLKKDGVEIYSFLVCFFKVDLRRTKLLKYVPTAFLRWLVPLIRGRMVHAHLADHPKQIYYSHMGHLPGSLHFFKSYESSKQLQIHYKDMQVNQTTPQSYVLKVDTKEFALNLSFVNKKPPLFNGPLNKGLVGFEGGESYYYSLTNMDIAGSVTIDSVVTDVQGKGWMDHQWGNFEMLDVSWVWFGIQLEGGIEYMLFYLNTGEGNDKRKQKLINVSYQDGSTGAINDYQLVPLKSWTSPVTQQQYGTEWHLTFFDKGKQVELTISALIDAQEMNDLQSAPYYEGDCVVGGTIGREVVKGHAYLEVFNYDPRWVQRGVEENLSFHPRR